MSLIANSFPPVLPPKSAKPLTQAKVLVLGSSPGQISLAQHCYYAHPRNAFWWIMSELLTFAEDLPYQQRLMHLQHSGIVLWDVLQQCQRLGSLDSAIQRDSEVPNDIVTLLAEYQSITAIFFNGKAAYTLFKRHLLAELTTAIELIVLPSTSPAHASMSRETKLSHWRCMSEFL